MLNFQLLRIKVFISSQASLPFDGSKSRTPPEILREVLQKLPTESAGAERKWHVGNVEELDHGAFYFRIGRTTKATIEVFRDGKFEEQEFNAAPYTHALLDMEHEIVAIAKKSRLSRTTEGIGRQVVRVMNESTIARQLDSRFEIDSLSDPSSFISYIEKAHSVSRFWLAFSRPNPFDADDFVKPFQDLVKEADGKKGKAELKGEALKTETLVKLARSAASTGDDAAATFRMKPRAARQTRHLKGDSVSVSYEEPTNTDEKKGLWREIVEKYRALRGRSKS